MGTRGAGDRSASSFASAGRDAGSTTFGETGQNNRLFEEELTASETAAKRTRAQGQQGRGGGRHWAAAAAGYCLAVLVGMSGSSERPMSAVAARHQRQHPVAAMARNLFHPHARERRRVFFRRRARC